jgi:hypothetical protein
MRTRAWPVRTACRPHQRWRLIFQFAITLSCFLTVGCDLSKQQQNQALAAVTPWLELIDAQKYDESWRRTGDYFRGTITSDRWNDLMRAYRQPLGKVMSRSLNSARREKSLPGVPDANYIVLKFDTVFERKKKAVETVVTIVDQNGQLSIAGYYVE